MRAVSCFVLLSAILAPSLSAQTKAPSDARPPYEINISAGVAEKLLTHKEPVACPHISMAARITGTVVVVFVLGKNGDVLHPHIVSGPAMLRRPVLDAVRKYKYKPYLFNGKPIEVDTTVSVLVNTLVDCPAD